MNPSVAHLLLLYFVSLCFADIPFSGERVLGGGSPRFAKYNISSGEAFVVAYEFTNGDQKQIVSALSTNQGNTWDAPVVVSSMPGAVSDLANPNLYQLPSGRLVVAFRHHTMQSGQPTIYRIEVCYTDDMKTWQFLGTVEAYSTTSRVGIWEPFLYQVSGNAALFCAYAKELSNGEQNIVSRMSTDGGVTWGSEKIISHTAGSRDGMPSVATLADGSLLAVFEGFWAGTWGKFTVNSRRSFDHGATWTEPQAIHVSPGTKNSGAPWATGITGNRAFVIFMTDEDWTGAQNWPDHASVKVLVGNVQSTGISWGSLQSVNGPGSYWPSSYFLGSHSSLYVTYNNVYRVAQV